MKSPVLYGNGQSRYIVPLTPLGIAALTTAILFAATILWLVVR